ncbi:lytic transglycosylase domain-containing protein [Agromyces tardus]|jgi:membrane-bound lytic murein transglycosylase B|nr:lytic murein transglycosylase [Agromyces tardus]
MSWDDDSTSDEFGEHRRARATGWEVVRRVLGYVGLVAGVVALAVGAIYAVSTAGVAFKPSGFAAPALGGGPALPRTALPPATLPDDRPAASDEPLPTDEDSSPVSDSMAVLLPRVDPEWTARIAAATGIPERALSAYASAHVSIADEQPECGVDWATIAAIGSIESNHGRYAGAVLDESGHSDPAIVGRALDGVGVVKIADTDQGLLDGDPTWDRAVGPMQFIPSTWVEWGSDANGDDVADPNQIDDAALATARYLCASGPMTSDGAWRAAIYSYNHDSDYVDKVARVANEYAAAAEQALSGGE